MSENKITFTNNSVIIPIELSDNDKPIRGQRSKIIDWQDLSCGISKDELDKILDGYVNKNIENDNKLDSKGGI